MNEFDALVQGSLSMLNQRLHIEGKTGNELPKENTQVARSLGHITVNVEPRIEWVHMCPPAGSGIMPCCGRTPFEVPTWNRMTLDPLLVTCPLQQPPYEDPGPEANWWDDRIDPDGVS